MLSAACHPNLGMRDRKDLFLQISQMRCYFTKCEALFFWGFCLFCVYVYVCVCCCWKVLLVTEIAIL